MNAVKLTGKTVLVTGANTGIGKVTARELAGRGARVILGCRNEEKGQEAKREIVQSTNNENVVCMILDLSSLESIKKFSEEFNKNESRLDILVCNAGVFTSERRETKDGFEMQFGTNHLGHFYLTYLLLNKIKASAPSRIVIVSSEAHELEKIDLNDLQCIRSFGKAESYSRSKTANVLFSTHLSKLLEGTGVTTYCLHPGVITTELTREYQGTFIIRLFNCCYSCRGKLLTPEQGAATTLYCCLEPSIAQHTGRYYSECREKKAKAYATNPDTAEKLWNISADLCHVSPVP